MVKITTKIKLRITKFWICDNCQCYHQVCKFSEQSTDFVKSYSTTPFLLVQII